MSGCASRICRRPAEDLVEHVERVALVAAAHVKMQRVDAHPGRLRGGDRLLEPVRVHAELRRLLAGIAQAFVVAGAEPGIQADADRAARAAPPEPADRADRIAVDVHARMRLQDCEVGLRHRVSGKRDLVLAKIVLEREFHFRRRAGVDAATSIRAQVIEQRRETVRLDGVIEVVRHVRRIERVAQAREVLAHAPGAVDVSRSALGGE